MCTQTEQFVILQTNHVKQRYELLSQLLICFYVSNKAGQHVGGHIIAFLGH